MTFRRECFYAGSDPVRRSAGVPGHCETCLAVGHLVAHPRLTCAAVGCGPEHVEQVRRVAELFDVPMSMIITGEEGPHDQQE